MSRGTKRGFVQKDEALAKLAAGRRGAIQVSTQAKINSPEYRAAQNVMTAIDVLAEKLTGDPTYYHLKAAPAHAGGSCEERASLGSHKPE